MTAKQYPASMITLIESIRLKGEEVVCPTCAAPIGKPCTARSGTHTRKPHTTRIDLLRELVARKP